MSETALDALIPTARFGRLDVVREQLAATPPGRWFAGEPAALGRAYRHARSALAAVPDVQALLDLHLLLAPLVGEPPPPSWALAWADAHLPAGTFFPAPLPHLAAAGVWRRVPLLVVRNGEERLRHLVVGFAPDAPGRDPWPDWAGPLLDESARSALADAIQAAETAAPAPAGCRPWIIPLLAPEGPDPITGRSLGLPAGLGLVAAAEKRPVPRRLATTGDLSADGAVGSVAGMDAKARLAVRERFTVLLHPPGAGSDRDGLTAIPVSHLARARLLADLHRRDRAGELAVLAGMLDDPDRFIRNVDGLPAEWLRRVRETGDHRPVIRTLGRRPERFARLADRLERAVYQGRTDRAAAMADLLTEDDLTALADHAPLAAFRWCTARLSLCNHTGRVPEAGHWSRRAEALLPAARRADLDRVVDYFNHRLVARHNRYRFSAELPPHLAELLKLLTDQYRMQCAAGCPTRMVLGRAWGTIAQNHAFCGPAHLDRVRELTHRARRALGEDTVPEHREEWLRQLHYLTYALLDAGPDHFAEARELLFRYLEIENWADLWPRFSGLSRWRHALTARFLADAGGPAERAAFLAAAAETGPTPAPVFPWPTWCFNAGRVAQARSAAATARGWFRKSLDLCLAPSAGPSVRVMALLPLSALHAAGERPPETPAIWDRIRDAARVLDRDHFRALSDAPERALAAVADRPERWFPFLYR